MSFVDRHRACYILELAGLDALVIAEPEGFRTISGVSQGVAALFRRAGAGFAVLPAGSDDSHRHCDRRPFRRGRSNNRLPDARCASPVDRACRAWGRRGSDRASRRRRLGGTQAVRVDFARPATFDLRLALTVLTDLLTDRGSGASPAGIRLSTISRRATPRRSVAAFLEQRRGQRLGRVRSFAHGQDGA